MIIYRESIEKFISQCLDGNTAKDIGSIISDRMRMNGISYFGDSQVNAWNASLPEMAMVLKDMDVDKNIDVAVEYKLVQSRDRIDFLICGEDDSGKENVVVVELKQWSQARPTHKQYFVNTFGGGGDGDYWHPSYQAYNYAQILVNFNEYVRDKKVQLPSCSYLHNMDEGNSVLLDDKVKYPLVETSPVFYQGQKERLGAYISKFVKRPNKNYYTILKTAGLFLQDFWQRCSQMPLKEILSSLMTNRRLSRLHRSWRQRLILLFMAVKEPS